MAQPVHVIADLDRGPERRPAKCHARQPQSDEHRPVSKQKPGRHDQHVGGISHEFPRRPHGDRVARAV